MRTEQPSQGDADIAPIGALIGDPTRARVLTALTDGRALPASRLAAEAGVAPSTVSEHLARLLAAGLVTMRPEGRSRFYRLASPEVAEALEADLPDLPAAADPLAAPGHPRPRPAGGPHLLQPPGRPARGRPARRVARGRAAVRRGRAASPGAGRGGPAVRPGPRPELPAHPARGGRARGDRRGPGRGTGPASRRPVLPRLVRAAHHLAGPLGTALADRLFALDWVRRTDRRRVVRVTDSGRENLPGTLGLAPATGTSPRRGQPPPHRLAADGLATHSAGHEGPFKAREVRGEDQPGMTTVASLGHEHPALDQDLGRDLQVLMLTPQAFDRGR